MGVCAEISDNGLEIQISDVCTSLRNDVPIQNDDLIIRQSYVYSIQTENSADLESGRCPEHKYEEFCIHRFAEITSISIRFWSRSHGD